MINPAGDHQRGLQATAEVTLSATTNGPAELTDGEARGQQPGVALGSPGIA